MRKIIDENFVSESKHEKAENFQIVLFLNTYFSLYRGYLYGGDGITGQILWHGVSMASLLRSILTVTSLYCFLMEFIHSPQGFLSRMFSDSGTTLWELLELWWLAFLSSLQ